MKLNKESLTDKFKRRFSNIKNDFIAGLIVSIVAIPLAIGFSIASGVPPIMGIYAAIIGGFFAAVFGGSEYQISGPTGAMVVIILSVASKYGIEGLILATILAGIILLILSALKFGKAIEYIPHPVIVGFTAGIAVLIFFGQINNFFGISPSYPDGASFITKTGISFGHILQSNIYAIILTLITIAILYLMPRISKKIPGSIVAVTFGLSITYIFNGSLHLKVVGDVGKILSILPHPHIPLITWDLIIYMMPAALTIATLAAIESLLSAVVADGMTGSKHNSNKELRGQGIANIMSALFGGLPVTGAIARTATNIRNGGKTRLVGIIHAIILLGIVMLLGPIFSNVPLAVIAGILMFVAFNMVEWNLVFEIFRMPLSDVTVLLTTFGLTVFVDLTIAIEVGIVLAALLFMKRMGDLYKVEEHAFNDPDETEYTREVLQKFHHPDISIYTLNGPLFFGAAAKLDQELNNTPGRHKHVKIIRMKYVPVIDASGISALKAIVHNHKRTKGIVLFSTVQPQVYKLMERSGLIKEVGHHNVFKRTNHAFRQGLIASHKLRGEPARVTAEEIKKYDLTNIDADEKHLTTLNDIDPVEEIIKNTGIDQIPKKTIEASIKIGKVTSEYRKKHIERTLQHKKEIINSTPIHGEKLKKLKRIKF
jgi:SulP family sulfate permease